MIQQKKKTKKVKPGNFLVGAFLTIATQPFEVLRTTSVFNTKKGFYGTTFSDLYKQIIQMWQIEGIRSFYRGGFLALIKNAMTTGIFFTGLENFKYLLKADEMENQYLHQFLNTLSAGSATFICTFALSPLNVLKTRFEVFGQKDYLTINSAINKIYKEEGLKGFYRGILPTLLRDIPWSSLQYFIYNVLIDQYQYLRQKKAQDNSLYIFFAGAFSSGLSLLMVYPFDNIRVRYQGKKLETRSLRNMFSHVFQTQGFVGFYKGYLPRLLKKCTSGALTWTLYEKISQFRKKED